MYVKQTWQTGDVVTSAKLNHMEDGIAAAGGGVLVVNVTDVDGTPTCDKTAGEIMSAMETGRVVFKERGDEGGFTFLSLMTADYTPNDGYTFVLMSEEATVFVADTANDYPVVSTV